jgi:uncharacterized protein (TIGR03435 family)
MREDLRIRNYSPSTVRACIRCIADFAEHFNKSPDKLSSEEDVSMADFSRDVNLLGSARLPDGSQGHIIDATGLTEHYDFKLRFDSSTNTRPTVIGPGTREAVSRGEVGSGLPDVFSALDQQLGLRLQKVKAMPMDTIVVDGGTPVPTAN